LLFFAIVISAPADDWPEWRGKGRLGVWNETGIVDKLPQGGLKPEWRTAIGRGWSGPAVSNGRIYLTDFTPSSRWEGKERAVCLDEKTGKILWTREWDANYLGLQETYATGPRATPTVDGDRVYVIGAKCALYCLDSKTGAVRWSRDFVKEYSTQVPTWGVTSAPLVDGERLLCNVGGERDARVMAFDKTSGKEIWRALPTNSEPGYAQPVLIDYGKARQLILWYPLGVASLNPATGKIYWEQPFKVNMSLTVATPVRSGSLLFLTTFYSGPLMLSLDDQEPRASVLWKGKSASEINTDGLHSLISTPAIVGEYIYGICSYGQLRCLNARTGERIWETQEVTKEKARWATGHMVRHGDVFFINNDRGDLIIASLTPAGYKEISRTSLIKPTSNPGNRRELGAVNWSHPAYANRHIVARNDEEIIRVDLSAR
jgi:outer membrane protein assembly factor BamB